MDEKKLFAELEPTDAQRSAARTLYGLFIAFIDVGFDEEQALRLVGSALTAVITDDD